MSGGDWIGCRRRLSQKNLGAAPLAFGRGSDCEMLLVIDIGKTNMKVGTFARGGVIGLDLSAPTPVRSDGPYPHFDVETIWEWLLESMKRAASTFAIEKICVATHGAAAALIADNANLKNSGLALPVIDYEWEGVREFDGEYDELRPAFDESFSPALPVGLNLGRQLYWQSKRFAKAFDSARCIVPYAQYWSWRLCGIVASEVSALGCHTDLWAPKEKSWSSLANRLGWRRKFAPISPAWSDLGMVLPAVASATGIPGSCRVLAGVHDSNASYARFLNLEERARPTVVTTGTWAISMRPGGDLERLDENRDMLANVDVTGAPVACARFMGGREYADICALTGAAPNAGAGVEAIRATIDENAFALPDFSGGSGPFGGRRGEVVGEPGSGGALATLYLALMIDHELDLLDSRGPVVIEGRFAENSSLCALVAALRPEQSVTRHSDIWGVAHGCLALAHWRENARDAPELVECSREDFGDLGRYRDTWRRLCKGKAFIHA